MKQISQNSSDILTREEDIGISGDELFIYSWLVFGVLCQLINIFGIVTNIINIICFVKQGFHDSVNISLLGLSISDLGSLVTMIGICLSLTPAITTASLPFEPIEVSYLVTGVPHLSFTRISSCITAMITLERCLCITAPLKVKNIITPKRAAFVNVSIFIIIFCSSAPAYVVNKLAIKFSPLRNKTIFGLVFTEDRDNVEIISTLINNFAAHFGAFLMIVICTAILSVKLRSATKWRQKSISSTQVDRVSNRNQKVAKMILMISLLFITCFVPISVIMLAVGFTPSLAFNGKHVNIAIMISGICCAMECVNSSLNIVIYYQMSSKYRETFCLLFCKEQQHDVGNESNQDKDTQSNAKM